MWTKQAREQLERCLADVRQRHESADMRRDIAEVVNSVLASLRGDLSREDIRLYTELESLARYIQEAKAEIVAIRPDDINQEYIPRATDELDAIVAATEEATGGILDCAEQMEALSGSLAPGLAAEYRALVTRIYEACNFQDITGQRINKVVSTLKIIEERINAMLQALGHEDTGGDMDAQARAEAVSDPDETLLGGPQLPEKAISQDDIDALLER